MVKSQAGRVAKSEKEFTGVWIAGMVAVGMLLALIAAVNARPIGRMLERMRIGPVGTRLPADWKQQLARYAGPMMPRLEAVGYASALVVERARGESLPLDQKELFDRLLSADPDNAAVPYMLAALESARQGPPAERKQVADVYLRQANDRPSATWYDAERREIWTKIWKNAGLGDVEAMIHAEQTVGFGLVRAFRETGNAFVRMGGQLAAVGDEKAAAEMYGHAINLARGAVMRGVGPAFTIAAAELLEEAHRQRSLLAVVADRTARQADLAAAQRAQRFLVAYRRAADTGPYNAFDPGAKRATRPVAYRQMMSALLSTGVWAAATATAAALMLLAALLRAVARLPAGQKPAMSVASRFWFFVGVGGTVVAPAFLATAVLRAVPMHEEYWASMSWISQTILGVCVLTAWAILAVAWGWAGRCAKPASGLRRIWHGTALAVVVLATLTLLPQYGWFGRNESWFERSLQLPWAVWRYQTLATLPLILGIAGGIVWLAVAGVNRFLAARNPSKEVSENKPSHRRVAVLRGVLMVSAIGFVTGGTGLLLAERGFYRYDAKYRALYIADMTDEITARLGPAWKTEYFAPPATPPGGL